MSDSSIQILPYSAERAIYFKTINLEWIEQFFVVEAEDAKVLNDPQTHIIDKGGDIVFAQYQGDIVGTCGLKKWDDESYELVKMGVTPKAQGLHLGQKLGQAIIDSARKKGCKRLFLESNRKLTPAINLYKKLGFKEIEFQDSCSDYQRCDISMEMLFD
ncbi:MAG: GNAT family N-acetyltransferase [Kangiellaceae bacterium]|nr:GNAT family N-acetyltransferase [Kangiellaceae bacterium]